MEEKRTLIEKKNAHFEEIIARGEHMKRQTKGVMWW